MNLEEKKNSEHKQENNTFNTNIKVEKGNN